MSVSTSRDNADELLLLCSTIKTLHKVISSVKLEYDVSFNSSKAAYSAFDNKLYVLIFIHTRDPFYY